MDTQIPLVRVPPVLQLDRRALFKHHMVWAKGDIRTV